MTAEEVAEVYMDIRPGLLRVIQYRYGKTKEDAEDLLQNALVGLLQRPEVYLGMIRPEVEAWFKRHDAGPGRGLKGRVQTADRSAQRARTAEEKFLKIRLSGTYLMNGEELTLPHQIDFTNLVIAKVDAEKAPPPKPKRKYTRKPKPKAVNTTANF